MWSVRVGKFNLRSPDKLVQVRVRDGPSFFFFFLSFLVLRSGCGFGFTKYVLLYSVLSTYLNYLQTSPQPTTATGKTPPTDGTDK